MLFLELVACWYMFCCGVINLYYEASIYTTKPGKTTKASESLFRVLGASVFFTIWWLGIH